MFFHESDVIFYQNNLRGEIAYLFEYDNDTNKRQWPDSSPAESLTPPVDRITSVLGASLSKPPEAVETAALTGTVSALRHDDR